MKPPLGRHSKLWPKPFRPWLAAPFFYLVHHVLKPGPIYQRLATFLERHERLYRVFVSGERLTKERLFGCEMCGQCALPATGYTCPMTCPKQLRNGPCGGVSPSGQCEVHPELQCVWVTAFERAEQGGHGADFDLIHRPVDSREAGRSSWVNYWLGRDEELWMDADARSISPLVRRDLGLVPR
jgi:hypothetical protein